MAKGKKPTVIRVVDRRGVLRTLRWNPKLKRYLFAPHRTKSRSNRLDVRGGG